MQESSKSLTAVLITANDSPEAKAFTAVLQKACDLFTFKANSSTDIEALRAKCEKATIVIFDAESLANGPALQEAIRASKNRVLLLNSGTAPDLPKEAGLDSYSVIVPFQLGAADQLRLVLQAANPHNYPGFVGLFEKDSKIVCAKIADPANIGTDVDILLKSISEGQKGFQRQHFNFRQLLTSMVYLATDEITALGIKIPVVDVQVAISPKRLGIAIRFQALPELTARIQQALMRGDSIAGKLLWNAANYLIVTEIGAEKNIELKAALSDRAEFSGNPACSFFVRRIDAFSKQASAVGSQQFTFESIGLSRAKQGFEGNVEQKTATTIQANPNISESELALIRGDGNAPQTEFNDRTGETAASNSDESGLNYKLRADMLVTERDTLQGLVKKKTILISELNRSVNQAQRELIKQKTEGSKDLKDLRLKLERTKKEKYEIAEKLKHYQRVAEELQAKMHEDEVKKASSPERLEANAIAQEAETQRRNYESLLAGQSVKDAKINELQKKLAAVEEISTKNRDALNESRATVADLKAKNLHLTKQVELNEKESLDQKKKDNVRSALEDKCRELLAQMKEVKNREGELEREVKRLNLRIETMESTSKGKQQNKEKKLENSEKHIEEIKRRMAEQITKYERQKEESRRQLEDTRKSERELKRQNEELQAQRDTLARKVEELTKALKSGTEKKLEKAS